MELTDIAPVEDWIRLEKEFSRRSGLNAAVFNAAGTRITDYVFWANRLCPLIKGNPKGQQFICAVAHQNLAAQAASSGRAVIEACDAGMLKLVVPIFYRGEFLGVAGGCGSLETGETVDSFLIHKTVGLTEEQISAAADDIRAMSQLQAEAYAGFIEGRIQQMVNHFDRNATMSA